MKKKILVIGITMAAAGSEKSFLSFAETIDYEAYDVDLLLAAREGDFLPLVPKQIRVLDMGKAGELFKINRQNAVRIILKRFLLPNPLRLFGLLPYIIAIRKEKDARRRSFAANRLWLHMMKKMAPVRERYDLALAYWGDRTMFYMVDKVRAARKVAWLHFDYGEPPREDALYERYFSACDRVVTVSDAIETSLKSALPAIADRVITVENRISGDSIRKDAALPADFGDDFGGMRILTVGRICAQKGYDLALGAIARLLREGYPIRWYILGKDGGEAGYAEALAARIASLGIGEAVRFLGIRQNPYPLMRACDLYLQPSRHEGKPIAVEEAKLLARPILVTNYRSAKEQLAGGMLGMICEISEEGIYAGLRKMLDDPALRASFSENNVHFPQNSGKKTPFLQILT